jgi:Beta/Gamma crystallin
MAVAPEVVLYQDINFGGGEWRTNLGYSYVGDSWNDTISSIIVVAGTWQFWRDRDFQGVGDQPWILGPGYYSWVEAVGIPNDTISSFLPIAWGD